MAKNQRALALKPSLLWLFAAVFALAVSESANAFNVITPGDFIIAIDLDKTTGSSSPPAETVDLLLDGNLASKYLNFGDDNTGFIVTPNVTAALQSFTMTTANDAPGRDPGSWTLWGTNEAITTPAHSNGREQNWTLIDMGDLMLTDDRGVTEGPFNVSNSTTYNSYKMTFPVTKQADIGLMQLADISFFSGLDGGGASMLTASDPIIPIRDVDPTPSSNSPEAERPVNLIDRDLTTKYLNFGAERSGFIVTPSTGSSIINKFSLTTANDFNERDPATWELYGTNEAITTEDNGIGDEQNWTLIDSGTFDDTQVSPDRFTKGVDVEVANNTSYTSYRMIFPTVRGGDGVCCMQISEISLDAKDLAILRVNRQTGEATIEAIEDVDLGSYQLTSAQTEGLVPSEWDSIAATSGDPNEAWVETSALSTLLAEEDDANSGPNDGRTLLAGQTISIGNIWQSLPSSFEDLDFAIRAADGRLIGGAVEYTGTEIVLGDYSGNGTVGPEDWPMFAAGYGGTYDGLTALEAYLGGDLDSDFDSDIHDFNLFVAAAGGAAALFGVPEPASMGLLLGAAVVGLRLRRRREGVLPCLAAALAAASMLPADNAQAQSFSVVGPNTPSAVVTSIPADQMNENENSGPINLFDDQFITPLDNVNIDLFSLNYADFAGTEDEYAQYAGLGIEQKTVFFDFGSSVNANWFAYAQRSGGNALADRVGQFEFWFSNSDFGGVTPASAPDTTVNITPTDNRLLDSVIRPYSLYGDHSGRYVAMRLTVSEISANLGVGNIGGHEFRLLSGPSDVVISVDRATGEMTLSNNLSGAASMDIKSLTIESPSGGLDASGFDGLGGASGAFPAGNGSGNGWEVGGGSDLFRLADGYFSGDSTLAAGTSGLSLGTGYNPLSLAEDLVATWTNPDGGVFNARVVYTGVAPEILLGDFNDDGTVDAADYTVWRDNLGTNASLPNDKTPGVVSENDYLDWRSNYGASASASLGSSAAPEPAAALLFGAGLSVALAARRRDR